MTCSAISPLWIIGPMLLWVAWYGARSDRRYNAALEGFHSSPLGKRYVTALERIAARPQSTRSRPRSGARKPPRSGRR